MALERFPAGHPPTTAVGAVGGERPVAVAEFARRAWASVANPQHNPVFQVLDACGGAVAKTPPLLGIFNDIPRRLAREDEAKLWAKAGFSWVVNDGEHQCSEGRYGAAENAMQLRAGLLPIQRLHREAVSAHGDALQLGARATMRPYATTVGDAEQYFRAMSFPVGDGRATRDDRGGFPVRRGDRTMTFTPASLRAAEVQTQGWLQFETGELLLDPARRDAVLDVMAAQGPGRACGFVGPFDAVLRDGASPALEGAISDLFREATKRGLLFGRVVGSGSMGDPADIEDAMVKAIQDGCRLVCVHWMTSDLPFVGAAAAAEPFFRACKRCGF